jgi:HYDIN/CFA65/VesB-like, Ig-like domain
MEIRRKLSFLATRCLFGCERNQRPDPPAALYRRARGCAVRDSRRTGVVSVLALVMIFVLLGCQSLTHTFPTSDLRLTKSKLDFGSVPTGSSKTVLETVSNSGPYALTISQISSSGAGFGFSGINPPVTLSTGQSFTFSVSFTPQSSRSVKGALSISSNASNDSLSVRLTGTGSAKGQLAITPFSINFGNAVVGERQSHTAILSATDATVTVSSAGADSSEFSVTGVAFPLTIHPGHTASFTVTFAPQEYSTASANITFASDASNSSTILALALGLRHSSTVLPSPGMRVSRATWSGTTYIEHPSSGGPYAKLTSVPRPGTSFTDGTVQRGRRTFT